MKPFIIEILNWQQEDADIDRGRANCCLTACRRSPGCCYSLVDGSRLDHCWDSRAPTVRARTPATCRGTVRGSKTDWKTRKLISGGTAMGSGWLRSNNPKGRVKGLCLPGSGEGAAGAPAAAWRVA